MSQYHNLIVVRRLTLGLSLGQVARREGRDAACELLLGSDEALKNRVHTVLVQALPELFFEGQDLTLRIRGEDFSLEKRPSAAKPA